MSWTIVKKCLYRISFSTVVHWLLKYNIRVRSKKFREHDRVIIMQIKLLIVNIQLAVSKNISLPAAARQAAWWLVGGGRILGRGRATGRGHGAARTRGNLPEPARQDLWTCLHYQGSTIRFVGMHDFCRPAGNSTTVIVQFGGNPVDRKLSGHPYWVRVWCRLRATTYILKRNISFISSL